MPAAQAYQNDNRPRMEHRMQATERNCCTCVYWRLVAALQDAQRGEILMGYCRYSPPINDTEHATTLKWPVTEEHDRCAYHGTTEEHIEVRRDAG